MLFAIVALFFHCFVAYSWSFDNNYFNVESTALRALIALAYAWYSTYGMYLFVKKLKGEK